MNQLAKRNQRGFTLIELMLSMTFVAILLLTIALTVIQMGTTYNRGMTLKELNQVARDVSDDLRRTVQSSGAFAIAPNGAETVDYLIHKDTGGAIIGGRVCTGSVSYLWNNAKQAQLKTSPLLAYYTTASGAQTTPLSLAKVPDAGKAYCQKNSSNNLVTKNIRPADGGQVTELLKPGDRTIGLLAFSITAKDGTSDPASGQRLYTVSYRLSTGSYEAINDEQTECRGPGDPQSNLTYCNVQDFSIVLRIGNTVN